MRKKNAQSSSIPFILGAPALIWQVLFFYVPLLLTICGSFIAFSENGIFEGFTIGKIVPFFQKTYLKIILSSILLALSNTIFCFLIAYPVAYFIAFRGKTKKNLFLFLLMVPFWTNFLLHVYAWFFVLEKEGVLNRFLLWIGLIDTPIAFMNSLFATLLMMIYHYLPFMVLPIYSFLEKFDYRLIEASLDLGASWWSTFKKIMLPLSLPGIRAGFFLVYVPSFGEFAIPELMGGDKNMFVGSVISRFILGDQTGSLGAAFTVIACAVLLVSSAGLYFLLNLLLSYRTVNHAKK